MKKITVLFVLLLSSSGYAQSYKEQFMLFNEKNDTISQWTLLKKWEASKKEESELYVAYFKYYASKSRQEMLRLGTEQPNGESLALQDSLSNNVGYLGSDITYDRAVLKTGFDYADKGIAKFPTRLDIRFGKVYMFGVVQDYDAFADEIITAINYSAVIKNKWTWTDDKILENPESFFLGTIQSYFVQLYNTNDDGLLSNMERISKTVLKYYPDHIESLSDLSIVYMLQGDYDQALGFLLKAEKLAPEDTVVLNNIAQCYKMKEDTTNAIAYYNLMIKYGEQETKDYASKRIEELKNQ